MAFLQINTDSSFIGPTEINVLLPQKNWKTDRAEPYKTLYLLHGLGDDQSAWMRRTSIERYAEEYNIAVIMPCCRKSFYCNMRYGEDYYSYIAKELPALMEQYFNLSQRREDRYAAGLSMGGYGAIKLALREPDKFCTAAGLSSAVGGPVRWKNGAIGKAIMGEEGLLKADDDLFRLAEKTVKLQNAPRLFMAIGKQDTLYDDNTDFRRHLDFINYPYTYLESDGSHNWEFWDKYIKIALDWMFEKQ